jgi:hypothetical protein
VRLFELFDLLLASSITFIKKSDFVRFFRSVITKIALKDTYFPAALSRNIPVIHNLLKFRRLYLRKEGWAIS